MHKGCIQKLWRDIFRYMSYSKSLRVTLYNYILITFLASVFWCPINAVKLCLKVSEICISENNPISENNQ